MHRLLELVRDGYAKLGPYSINAVLVIMGKFAKIHSFTVNPGHVCQLGTHWSPLTLFSDFNFYF